MGLRADSARPQRVSGSARTDSQRAESARNPIALHVNFGDDSALSAFIGRTQWTVAEVGPMLTPPPPPPPRCVIVGRLTRPLPLYYNESYQTSPPPCCSAVGRCPVKVMSLASDPALFPLCCSESVPGRPRSGGPRCDLPQLQRLRGCVAGHGGRQLALVPAAGRRWSPAGRRAARPLALALGGRGSVGAETAAGYHHPTQGTVQRSASRPRPRCCAVRAALRAAVRSAVRAAVRRTRSGGRCRSGPDVRVERALMIQRQRRRQGWFRYNDRVARAGCCCG